MELHNRKYNLGDIVRITDIDSSVVYEVIGFAPDTIGLFTQAMTSENAELNVKELVICKPLHIINGFTLELKEDQIELVNRS
jgi:hypothetical protein